MDCDPRPDLETVGFAVRALCHLELSPGHGGWPLGRMCTDTLSGGCRADGVELGLPFRLLPGVATSVRSGIYAVRAGER